MSKNIIATAIKDLNGVTSGKKYNVIRSTGKTITIIDDSGAETKRLKISFMISDVLIKTCNTDKFNLVKKGKSYEILASMGSFYYVRNEKGVKAKYSKKYFDEIVNENGGLKKKKDILAPKEAQVKPVKAKPVKAEVIPEPVVKEPVVEKPKFIKEVMAVFKYKDVTEYGKIYKVISEDDKNYNIDINGKPVSVLKIRFKDLEENK